MKKLLLLLLLASPLPAETANADWMAAFGTGEPVRVNYRSDGCFLSEDLDFTFQSVGNQQIKVSVTENVGKASKTGTRVPANSVNVGTVTLAGRDVERFIKLLFYYNELRHSEDVTVISTVDGGTLDRLDLLTFDEIISRIRLAKPDRPAPDDPVSSAHPK